MQAGMTPLPPSHPHLATDAPRLLQTTPPQHSTEASTPDQMQSQGSMGTETQDSITTTIVTKTGMAPGPRLVSAPGWRIALSGSTAAMGATRSCRHWRGLALLTAAGAVGRSPWRGVCHPYQSLKPPWAEHMGHMGCCIMPSQTGASLTGTAGMGHMGHMLPRKAHMPWLSHSSPGLTHHMQAQDPQQQKQKLQQQLDMPWQCRQHSSVSFNSSCDCSSSSRQQLKWPSWLQPSSLTRMWV